MGKDYETPYVGEVPSLTTTLLEPKEDYPLLRVSTFDFNRRYAVQITDQGLDGFGIHPGDYLIFREQRWPTSEAQICLVTFGDEVTIRILEYIYNSEVTLRVTGDQIPPLELAPTDFAVIGVLTGVVKQELAQLVYHEGFKQYDW
ncbi:LexA family protein [Effusibacillus pohliae]|uniref:LexA family protein n=1 Tax=Effusibacillus pohliae TaxID=232270 RepID=UPI00036DB6FC|nr:S24 family peptidase [Effusibacillus pohliae]